jgi:hypothetical protein
MGSGKLSGWDRRDVCQVAAAAGLVAAATHVCGIVGDGVNSIIEALRKRQDRIRYVAVRHEEAAAFMASGFDLDWHAGLDGARPLSYAIAAKLAYPDRASVGDGGFAMPMAELTTPVANNLPIVEALVDAEESLANSRSEHGSERSIQRETIDGAH